MIPMRFINAWRDIAPWQDTGYIEQDLVISRALIEIFNVPQLRSSLVFRGGTALNKLYFSSSSRYSEDIDLVQLNQEPIGNTFDAIRRVLDPWLGQPKRSLKDGRANLYYRFGSEEDPAISMRLKIEINTREHFSIYEIEKVPFSVINDWFNGSTLISAFEFNELIATKLRALYSRKKGRDLYDLCSALGHEEFDLNRMLYAFKKYTEFEGRSISRAEFEKNLYNKQKDKFFINDMRPLLSPAAKWDIDDGFRQVLSNIIAYLPGKSWVGLPEEAATLL